MLFCSGTPQPPALTFFPSPLPRWSLCLRRGCDIPFVAEPSGVNYSLPRTNCELTVFMCSYELTAAVAAHTRPTQDQASQCSSMEWEGVHEAQPLTDKFWAIHSSWKRENQSFKGMAPVWLTTLQCMVTNLDIYLLYSVNSNG